MSPRDLADLTRLERIKALLEAQGHEADTACLSIFSMHGFRADLRRAAAGRDDVLLVDLASLYGERSPA